MTAAPCPPGGAARPGAPPRPLAFALWSDPTLRMLGAAIVVLGSYLASIGIHQSLIAVRAFGLSDARYSAVLLVAMAVSVGAGLLVGIVTDQGPHRRALALAGGAALVAGPLLVWGAGTPTAFALAHMLLFPVAGTLFGQIFAVGRLALQAHREADRPGLLAVLRALFAVPFVVVLPLWSLAFDRGLGLLAIYPVLAGLALAFLLLVALAWPPDARAPWSEAKSGLGLGAALREIAAGPVLVRVALMGVVHAGGAVAGIVVGLLFADAGRGAGDTALFFALFVAVEVAVTLMLGPLLRRAHRLALVAAGAATYAAFLGLLPVVAASPAVWLLAVPAGAGGALVYTLAIGYLQDLLAARPGAGSALTSLQRVAAEGTTTAVYAAGAWAQGYATVAVLGGLMAAVAALLLLRLDGRR